MITGEVNDAVNVPDLHLIDVCLLPHLDFPVSLDALKAGNHVVCEKLRVTSLAQAAPLSEAAEASGKILAPVFQYRVGPAMPQIQALQAAGLTGKV